MLTFVLYSRRSCHLCEQLAEELLPMIRSYAVLDIRDIDSRPEWREKYDIRIPVLTFENVEICQYRLHSAAQQRVSQIIAEVCADKDNNVA